MEAQSGPVGRRWRAADYCSEGIRHSRSLPCVAYVAQLLPLPPAETRTELTVLARLIRFPHCACPRAAIHKGRELKQPAVPPVRDYCDAIRLRAALQHKEQVALPEGRLQALRDVYLPTAFIGKPLLPEPGRDAPAFASILTATAAGTGIPQGTMEGIAEGGERQLRHARILASIVRERLPQPAADALARRAQVLLAGFVGAERAPTLEQVSGMVGRSPIFTWQTVRSWTFAWSTATGYSRDAKVASLPARRSQLTIKCTPWHAPQLDAS